MHTFLKFDKYKIIYALESFTACSLIYERQSNNRIRKFGPKQVGQMKTILMRNWGGQTKSTINGIFRSGLYIHVRVMKQNWCRILDPFQKLINNS